MKSSLSKQRVAGPLGSVNGFAVSPDILILFPFLPCLLSFRSQDILRMECKYLQLLIEVNLHEWRRSSDVFVDN